MSDTNLLNRMTARPEVFGGKPIIRDMRISVEMILSLLAQGVDPEYILDDYRELELDDIRAYIAYARSKGIPLATFIERSLKDVVEREQPSFAPRCRGQFLPCGAG